MIYPPSHFQFYRLLDQLWHRGEEQVTRGKLCKELTNFSYTLPPRVRFMCFNHRHLKLSYIKREFQWYLKGDRFDTSIGEHASLWRALVNQDGSINSNYGQYIFSPETGRDGQSNFARVIAELTRDPGSRRAVICILGNDHLNSQTLDYPCTAYLNFQLRQNRLDLLVRMRSQDVIYGLGNDAPCFSFIHELAWAALSRPYPGLELGLYHHSADSFHVYERHYEMVRGILAEPAVDVDHHETCPPMEPGSPFKGAFFEWLEACDAN